MKNIEIEYKYSAEGITRGEFERFVAKNLSGAPKPVRSANNGPDSGDHYFSLPTGENIRFRRDSRGWEMTSKVRLSRKNVVVRTEVNIELDPKSMDLEKAETFSRALGFKKDFSIRKDATIWKFSDATLSYYICYDETGRKEIGRFIEIEADEELDQKTSLMILDAYEGRLEKLGIGPKGRINDSLFEMYSKVLDKKYARKVRHLKKKPR